jgi:hypothetical protein
MRARERRAGIPTWLFTNSLARAGAAGRDKGSPPPQLEASSNSAMTAGLRTT